jgi:acetoin utilization deacetylase AcuC-like enzyme
VRFYYPDTPDLPLPSGHRFPSGKYRLLRDKIQRDRVLGNARLLPSPAVTRADLLRAHDEPYVRSVLDGTLTPEVERRIGLPWSSTLVARSLATTGGSLAAASAALEYGLSGQLAGGTHHAHRGFGSGYCVFNDLAVAALALLAEQRIDRLAIIDLDVHQGDGNAAILADHPGIFVLSLHGEKNFPFRKVLSTLDVGLPDGTEDDAYLRALGGALERIAEFRPELVLYLSGADPLKSDTLGRLSLTFEGLEARDRMVVQFCRRRIIPVSIAIGGGYANPITDSVTAYANTFRIAREIFTGV